MAREPRSSSRARVAAEPRAPLLEPTPPRLRSSTMKAHSSRLRLLASALGTRARAMLRPVPTGLRVFAVALLVRVLVLALQPSGAYIGWYPGAGELAQIARNLAEGRGFSSPFGPGDTPTAWMAPLVPALWAGVFSLFGVGTRVSLLVIVGLQVCASAAACALYWRIASLLAAREPRLPAALPALITTVLVLSPDSLLSLHVLWYSPFQEVMLALLFLGSLRFLEGPFPRRALRLGCIAGITALVNPLPLLFFGAVLAGLLWQRRDGAALRAVLLAGGIAALFLAPWSVRNRLVLGELVLTRSNFGVELRQGNGPGAMLQQTSHALHPATHAGERERYTQMGELAYARAQRAAALESMRADPLRTLRDSATRVLLFWTTDLLDAWRWGDPRYPIVRRGPDRVGKRAVKAVWMLLPIAVLVVLRCRRNRPALPGAALLGTLLLVLPLPYYLTHVSQLYGLMTRPYLVLLAGLAAGAAWSHARSGSNPARQPIQPRPPAPPHASN